MGFIHVKRRRNTSAIYIGQMPQEVNSSSLPEGVTSHVTDDQESKSSALRKSSVVDFGKSSGLVPNVVRNVGSNVGGGAHAPAAPSVFTVGDLAQLPNDIFIPPAAAKAARADIIEFLIRDAVFKIEAAEVIGNLLDRGALSKKVAREIIDQIDEGDNVQEILEGLR